MLIDISREAGVSDAIEALQTADAGLAVQLMDDAKRELEGAWIPALQARVGGYGFPAQDAAVIISGAAAHVGGSGFLLTAAQSAKPLSGGLNPYGRWYAVELGARRRQATIQTRSRKGKAYSVRKMLNRGLPSRQQHGRVAFDAASEVGTELARLWIRVTTQRYRDAVGDPDRG